MKLLNNLLLTSFLIFMIIGCDVTRKLDFDSVDSYEIKYESNEEINFGSTFTARIVAKVFTGQEIDVTESRYVKVQGSELQQTNNKFTITRNFPSSFDENSIIARISIDTKDTSFIVSDTIQLNFQGGFRFEEHGQQGGAGAKGEDGRNKIFSSGIIRDGNDGDNGTPGTSGGVGSSVRLYIWKKKNLYYLCATDMNDNIRWIYMTTASKDVMIKLLGGNGGTGGNGGDGGDGRDGLEKSNGKIKDPGKGGNGGDGASGGTGGAGGNLTLIIHPSANGFDSLFKHSVNGGFGGNGGAGGKAGDAGRPIEGQAAGQNGITGLNGAQGIMGAMGIFNVEFENFDPIKFE